MSVDKSFVRAAAVWIPFRQKRRQVTAIQCLARKRGARRQLVQRRLESRDLSKVARERDELKAEVLRLQQRLKEETQYRMSAEEEVTLLKSELDLAIKSSSANLDAEAPAEAPTEAPVYVSNEDMASTAVGQEGGDKDEGETKSGSVPLDEGRVANEDAHQVEARAEVNKHKNDEDVDEEVEEGEKHRSNSFRKFLHNKAADMTAGVSLDANGDFSLSSHRTSEGTAAVEELERYKQRNLDLEAALRFVVQHFSPGAFPGDRDRDRDRDRDGGEQQPLQALGPLDMDGTHAVEFQAWLDVLEPLREKDPLQSTPGTTHESLGPLEPLPAGVLSGDATSIDSKSANTAAAAMAAAALGMTPSTLASGANGTNGAGGESMSIISRDLLNSSRASDSTDSDEEEHQAALALVASLREETASARSTITRPSR